MRRDGENDPWLLYSFFEEGNGINLRHPIFHSPKRDENRATRQSKNPRGSKTQSGEVIADALTVTGSFMAAPEELIFLVHPLIPLNGRDGAPETGLIDAAVDTEDLPVIQNDAA